MVKEKDSIRIIPLPDRAMKMLKYFESKNPDINQMIMFVSQKIKHKWNEET